LATALNARHVIAWGPDGADERMRVANEMLALAERAQDSELALQARHWRIVDLLELGDGGALRDELDAYAELSAHARLPAFAWYVPMWRATIALIEGRIGDGLELSRRARDLGRQAGDANADLFFSEHYFTRMLVQGRISDVDPAGGGGVVGDIAERAETGPAWRAYRFTFAWWHATRGEMEEARRDFDAALADGFATIPRDVNWLASLASASEACVLLGDIERGIELRTLFAPYATRMVVNARGSSHAGSVAFQLAQLAALCGDIAEADRLFEDAARNDERAGAPAFVIRDQQRHGEFLLANGYVERGHALLRAASRILPRTRNCLRASAM
jgi:tetratricopeptide (TPR) repeat protein